MKHYFGSLAALTRDQRLIFASFLLWGISYGFWYHLQPVYIEFLGAEPEQVGAALGLAGIGVIFLYIPSGMLADRRRPKPIIMGGWWLGTLATLLLGLAPNWWWVIPAQALYLLSSFSRPAVSGYIASVNRGSNLSQVFALLSTGFSIGSIVGPAVGGWIAEVWGLRAVFFAATAVGLLSTLVMALIQDRPAIAPERRLAVHPRRLLADRAFLWQALVLLLIAFAQEVGMILAPNYLQDVKGLNLQQIGQLGTVGAIGMFVFMLSLGSMDSGRRLPFQLSQLALVATMLFLLLGPNQPASLAFYPSLLIAYFLGGAVWSVWPLSRGRISRLVSPEIISLSFAFLDTAHQVARTISPIVAGQLYAYHAAAPLLASIMALVGTMLLTLTLSEQREEPLVTAPAVSG